MTIPPRIEPGSQLPPDPAVGVATSHQDATVYDPEPTTTDPSGPPRTPLVLFAILIDIKPLLGRVPWGLADNTRPA